MKIASIETFTREPVTIVRVRTEDGHEGIGQTAPGQAGISALILHRQLARHALGREAADIGAAAERCVAGEYKYEGPHLCRALAGLDTALWDLRGRAEGRSVCALLGGTPRPLAVYASSMRRDTTPEEEAERPRRAQETQGFRAFAVRPFPRVAEGMLPFPEGPGWGVEINPAWLEGAERQVSSL